jgi:hypothetical protein
VLGLAITGAVLLVTHFVFGPATAIVTSALCAATMVLVWVAIPLRTLLSDR